MAGYNLFLFFLMKDRNYLYYFAFVATYGLYELAANGFTLGVLFPENPKIYDHFLWVLVVMPVLATNLFSWSFLHTSFYAPSMDRLLKGLFVAGILLIPAMFVTPAVAYKKIVGLNTLVVVAVSFLSSIPCYLKGYRPARFFSSPDSFMGRVRLPSHYPTLALSLSGSSPATA